MNKLAKKDFLQSEQWMRDNEMMLQHIPPTASVAAQQSLVPHISHRKEIYLIYPHVHSFDASICPQKICWWLDFSGKPQYVAVDTHDNEWLTMTLADIADFRNAIAAMERAGVMTLVYQKNEAKLYAVHYDMLEKIKK